MAIPRHTAIPVPALPLLRTMEANKTMVVSFEQTKDEASRANDPKWTEEQGGLQTPKHHEVVQQAEVCSEPH